jgi:hypothetical protein
LRSRGPAPDDTSPLPEIPGAGPPAPPSRPAEPAPPAPPFRPAEPAPPAPPFRQAEPVPAAKPRPGEPVPDAKPRPGEPVPAAEPRSGEPAAAAKSRPDEPSPAAPKPFSVWEKTPKPSQDPGPASGPDSHWDGAYEPGHAEPPSPDTQQKLEQLKDLYLTAQAIGEDALGKHFDEVSEMQRSLIREFFEKAGLGSKGKSKLLDDGSAQDDASLPGKP